jgi:hypothetical protein
MKTVLFLLFTIISINSFAQCKYTQNEVDEFNKKTRLTTKKSVLVNFNILGEGMYTYGKKLGDFKYIEIYWTRMSISSFIEGSEIHVLFEDGEVIVGQFLKGDIGSYNYTSKLYTINTTITFLQEHFEKLANKRIKRLRLFSVGGYIDLNVKDSTNFNKMIKCIL